MCVAFDDIVDIVDRVEDRTVGELKVLLYAGTHRQTDEIKSWEQKNDDTQMNCD